MSTIYQKEKDGIRETDWKPVSPSTSREFQLAAAAVVFIPFNSTKTRGSLPRALPTVNNNVAPVDVRAPVATEPGDDPAQLVGAAKAACRVLCRPSC